MQSVYVRVDQVVSVQIEDKGVQKLGDVEVVIDIFAIEVSKSLSWL